MEKGEQRGYKAGKREIESEGKGDRKRGKGG